MIKKFLKMKVELPLHVVCVFLVVTLYELFKVVM